MNENFWKHDDALWLRLASEGKFDLIEKLQKAFNRVSGFETIVVTREGFSENDRTHNMVLRSLREHGVNICDVMYEIGNLELALHGRMGE
jgi:hypothetical protein